MKKQITLCTLGTIFEWYEFALFACLAPIFSQIFFTQGNRTTALFMTFAIFASGYVMRPLGAIFFGQLGDRFGRKYTLIITIIVMTVATTTIGFIPMHSTFAVVLLVICRLLQGFASSGEYPGGLTLLSEQEKSRHPAFVASFGIFGTGIGSFAGAFVYFMLLYLLGQDAMVAWGWRIPFLIAAPLGIIGYLLRRDALESAAFIALKQSGGMLKVPVFTLLRSHFTVLIAMLSVCILTNTVVYINLLYFGTTLVALHKITAVQSSYLTLMVTFFYAVSILLFGFIADYVDKKKLLLTGCVLLTVSMYFLFYHVVYGSMLSQFVAQGVLVILLGWVLGPFASILPEQFPVAVRYTGVSVTVNFAGAFFGGSAPMVCHWLSEVMHSPLAPAFYVIFLAVLASAASVMIIRPQRDFLLHHHSSVSTVTVD